MSTSLTSPQSARRRWLIAGGVTLGVCALVGVEIRTHPNASIKNVLSMNYWSRRLWGGDRYDTGQALLREGPAERREVALTFDDGPRPQYGPQIADLLKKRGITATFFVIGFRVREYPGIVKQLSDDGFEIANHTYDHKRLPPLKPHEIASELRRCEDDIATVTGRRTMLMRPPGDEYDDKVLQVAKDLGYVTVSYTVGAKDFGPEQPSATVVQRVMSHLEPGAIILLHQTSKGTLDALPAIIDGIQQRGYHFVTVGQMLTKMHAQLPPLPKTHRA